MAIKRIDELGAATPLLTDFLPATPAGGPSTKATVKQLYESNLFAVSVAYTGIAPAPFGAIVSAKSGAQSGSTLTIPDGVTIETFVYSNGLSTTLTYANLAVIRSTFTMATWSSLTSLSFPVLTAIGGSFSPQVMGLLTTLSTPALAYVGGHYQPNNMAALTIISLPALTSIGVNIARTAYDAGRLNPYAIASLTSFTVPNIEVIGSVTNSSISFVTGTAALATFTMGSSLRRVEGSVIFTSAALTQASVDDILVRLAALDGTGLTTAYSTKTVTITGTSATPSATGLAAKATLVARGCTVTHN